MPDTHWRDASRAELTDGSCPDCGSPVAGGHTSSCETWIPRSQAAKLTAEAVAAVERPLRAHIDALTAAVEALPFVPDEDTEGWEWVSRSDVLAILRGEQNHGDHPRDGYKYDGCPRCAT